MHWIVGSSLNLRFLIIAIAAAVMVLGITQLRDMPVDVLPEFGPPIVEIQTEALGLSAAEVEELVTVPMEAILLTGVAWVDTIRSESIPGLSSIVLKFEPGTDILKARQMVQERLTKAHALPNVSKPPAMLQPLSSTSRVMMVGLTSKKVSHIQMSVLARWNIRPRLMGIPGVANVSIWGQRKRQLQVQVDPEHLRDQDVTLLDVIRATGNSLWVSPLSFLNASTPGTGGWIETPNQRLVVRHVLPITTAEELAQVTFEANNGQTLHLGDVANVVEDHQPLIGDAIVDDGPGLLLVIEKFHGANTLEVTRGVEQALVDLQPGLTGIEMDSTVFRPATFIETSIGNLTTALIIASIVVILALVAFFFDWRTALISLVAMSLSLVAAGLVLFFLGTTMNTMVLAGLVIALGAVVDDAIIDIDNIRRRLGQRRQEGSDPSIATILEASMEVRNVIVFATLIIALVLLPIFFMEGLSGALLKPLALSHVLALLASIVVALTVTPVLSLILLPSSLLERRESPLVRCLRWAYDSVFVRITSTPRWAYLGVGVAVVAGVAVVPLLGQELLPSIKENDLLIRWEGAPGTSHPAMNRIATQASRELRAIPGVDNVSAHVGRAVLSDEVVGINSGKLWVSVNPEADYDATVANVQEVVDGYPGLFRDVQTYLKERIRDVLAGSSDAIVVRIYGQDLDILRSKAEEVRQGLAQIEGVVEPRVESQVEEPTLEIEVDLAAAERHGIKPGDVRRAAAVLVNGIEVGSLFEEQKVFDVVVQGTPEMRHSVTSIQQLLIDTPSGGHVRLGEVADVRIVSALNVIKREAISRRIDVVANVEGRDLGSVARDVESRLQQIDFPLEYHAELLGEYAERQAAQRRVLGFAIAAAIGVFLLLQAAFGSWRLATLTFLTLPLTLVGGVLAALIGGGMISLGSLVGFITVFGVAVRNGLMLIRHYQHLQREEGEDFGLELVLRGTRERLTPIVMTAVITALAILPLVVLGDIPGFEMLHPMAMVILGGLFTSTLLNLFIVPALYLRFGDVGELDIVRLGTSPEPAQSR